MDSRGESAARLARNIACVKYTLFCFNIVAWVSYGLRFNCKKITMSILPCDAFDGLKNEMKALGE